MKKQISIQEIIKSGWKRTNENLGVYVVCALVIMCAFISLRILTEKIGFSSQIYFFIACVIAVYADVGIKKLFFFSEKPSFKDFFLPAPWKAYVISFLFLLICVGPLFSAYIYFLIALLSGNLISLPFLPYSIYVILGMLGVWGEMEEKLNFKIRV